MHLFILPTALACSLCAPHLETALIGPSRLSHPPAVTVAMRPSPETIRLPGPRRDSDYSVERALGERRSVRELSEKPLKLEELAQLLWAAQGITGTRGLRTAPSAGALYPLELYVVAGNVRGIGPGIYRYLAAEHKLVRTGQEDRRSDLERAALGQDWVRHNGVLLVFAAVQERTTWKYGDRGIRYIHIEVGHAAQNVLLQALSLGLRAAVVGAFDDRAVADILGMPAGERPLYLVPVGRPR